MKSMKAVVPAWMMALALGVGLSGCATPYSKDEMTPAGLTVTNKHSGTVLVNVSRSDKFVSSGPGIETGSVQDAVADSITQSGLFSRAVTAGSADYQLDVRLLKQTSDFAEGSLACDSSIIWELIRLPDHKLVYKDEVIINEHEAEVEHGLYATIPLHATVADSVQKNIQEAIDRMGRIKEFVELQNPPSDQSLQDSAVTQIGGVQAPASAPGASIKSGEGIPDGRAVVYIYRLSGETAAPMQLEANGKVLTTMRKNFCYEYVADPGDIEFKGSGGPLHCSFTLKVTAGQAYYLKTTIYVGSYFPVMLPAAKLEAVSTDVGASEMANCKLAQ